MEELEVPSEYMLAISRIYEKVICCVRMRDKFSDFFNSTIGIKQECALSLTLFGLCINELEEMVTKFVNEECVEEVAIGNVVIMLLLYADDVVLNNRQRFGLNRTEPRNRGLTGLTGSVRFGSSSGFFKRFGSVSVRF